jgi:hypothetical protein
VYVRQSDTYDETEDFQVIGEDLLDHHGDDGGNREQIPCRSLEDFVVFDLNNENRYVSLEEYDGECSELRACGIVKPVYVTEDGDDEALDDEQGEVIQLDVRLETSVVFYYEIEYKQDGVRQVASFSELEEGNRTEEIL